MDYENRYASKGLGVTGTTLGAVALGTSLLGGNNLLGNLFGMGNCNAGCSENMVVNRYELQQQKELTNKDMEIAYLKSRDAAKTDSLELYKYVDGKFACMERELADQRVFNATQIGTISCIQSQIAALMGLTKTIIPAANICPTPMPQFNSWTAPTTTTGT